MQFRARGRFAHINKLHAMPCSQGGKHGILGEEHMQAAVYIHAILYGLSYGAARMIWQHAAICSKAHDKGSAGGRHALASVSE